MPMQLLRRLWVGGLAFGLWAGGALAQTDSVTIDDQPTTEQRLARVNDLRQSARYADAADLLQELIDGARFKLVTAGDGVYIDAELWVRRELSRDPELLEAYRERHTASGERALAEALSTGSLPALREAYRRYGMTRPGLDAGLQLAGRLLERGDLSAADKLLAMLGRHPDEPDTQGRVTYLRGVCAALRNNDEAYNRAQSLLALMQPAKADELAGFAERLAFPEGEAVGGLIDAGPEPEGLELSLWDAPIANASGRGPSMFDGLRSLPMAVGETVLVNTGRQLQALDRASGQPLWASPEELGGRGGVELNQPVWLDTRGVAVSGGRVFAVLGDCRGIQGRGGAESVPPNLLVCVDARTGEVRWSRRSGEIGEGEPTLLDEARGGGAALQQSHFVGTPVTAQGQVFALVRRTNITGVQTTWLASFEAATGRMRWYRHIALVQVRHGSDAARITPQLMLAGDTLFLTDQIAVAASLDVHSGAYNWLRVLADDRSRGFNGLSLATEGVSSPPVLTPAGLVVQLALTEERLYLLDPADGRTVREMQADRRLVGSQYILDAGDRVLMVSRSYVVLWDGRSGEVAWVHPLDPGTLPRGRGAVTEQFAVIPTSRGITTLRMSDHAVLSEIDTLGGNLVALDAEVLVSANGFVRSYMSWDHAYARLVDRVEARPTDPGPGMSLASLALERGDNDDAVLDGLGFALASVGRLRGEAQQAERQRVIDGLRRMAAEQSNASDVLRARLLDLMAQTVVTAGQVAAYHLDAGRFHARRDAPDRAVVHYQSVMADPALAGAGYHPAATQATSPAGATAQNELLKLVRTHGRSIYQRYDALADQELEALLTAGAPEPDALARVARRYPLAFAASRALLTAGAQLEVQGHPTGALSHYQQAYASAISPDQINTAAGALLGYYERTCRSRDAEALLDRLAREPQPPMPLREGSPTPIAQWRAVFDAVGQPTDRAPRLAGALGQPVLIPGRLLLPPADTEASALRGGLFIHSAAGEVARLDPARPGEPRWSTPIEGNDLAVLADDQRQVLVWSIDAQRLYALDSATGRPLWPEPADLAMLQPDAPADDANIGGRRRPVAPPRLLVGPSVVCAVGPTGRVVGIDRYRGTTRWVADTGLQDVTAAALDPWTLAVAGVSGPEIELGHGKIVLLDLYTGNPVLDRVDLHVGFRPAAVGVGDGRVAVVGQAQGEAMVFDAVSGESRWRQLLTDGLATDRSGVINSVLVIEDDTGMVTVIGLADEVVTRGRFRLSWGGNEPGVRLAAMSSGVLLHGPRGVVAVDGQGKLRWRSETPSTTGPIRNALVGQAHVALVLQEPGLDATEPPIRRRAAAPVARYRIDLHDADTGLLTRSYTLPPLPGSLEPTRAVVAGRGIAFAMEGGSVLYLPGLGTPDHESVPASGQ
jgi:outer membrane protein assembly factor BamB